jgi:hypothetical protein
LTNHKTHQTTLEPLYSTPPQPLSLLTPPSTRPRLTLLTTASLASTLVPPPQSSQSRLSSSQAEAAKRPPRLHAAHPSANTRTSRSKRPQSSLPHSWLSSSRPGRRARHPTPQRPPLCRLRLSAVTATWTRISKTSTALLAATTLVKMPEAVLVEVSRHNHSQEEGWRGRS